MQMIIEFIGDKEVVLPLEHNYLLQAAIYHQIEQPAFRNFLHEQGFALGHRRFKLFVFSRLMGKFRMDEEKREIVFTPPCRLVICSPLSLFLENLVRSLLRQGRFYLGKNRLTVGSIKTRDTVVRQSPITVRMLSPLTVYSTFNDNGKPFTYYYSPFEPRFPELIKENLAKKYQLIFGRPADPTDFSFTPVEVRERDFKVVRYKGTIIKGWMGKYRLTGDPQLLEVALSAGLGAKNSQGFGCCELVEEED
ncbi:CRISPR-associated protein Cas6 [Ammonifex degensii KC4]|uniref:CRISPR-associated endoribonuclease n=2 Tax=Ammonifex degensii TaxID=42838 RepID=C9RCX9_AMMDK|nr:CRISPR-associated protein Cas6 [Ammonifex degensii KC4]